MQGKMVTLFFSSFIGNCHFWYTKGPHVKVFQFRRNFAQ